MVCESSRCKGRADSAHALNLLALSCSGTDLRSRLADLVQGWLEGEGSLDPGSEADCKTGGDINLINNSKVLIMLIYKSIIII